MSEFRAEDKNVQARLESKAEVVASETKELPDANEPAAKRSTSFGGDWKSRLAAMKVKAVGVAKSDTPKSIPEPGITAVGPISQAIQKLGEERAANEEAEAKIGEKVIEQEALVQKSDVVLNAEALFYELTGDMTVDDREVFKQVFMARINGALGLDLDAIRDQILAAHQVIYNERIGIQALLAYRAERLKDASSEEREKRLKEDFKFKPAKVAKSSGDATPRPKGEKKKEDPFVQMHRTMVDKFVQGGMTREDAKAKADKKIAKLKGDD